MNNRRYTSLGRLGKHFEDLEVACFCISELAVLCVLITRLLPSVDCEGRELECSPPIYCTLILGSQVVDLHTGPFMKVLVLLLRKFLLPFELF